MKSYQDYSYPGTSTLENNFGIKDPDILQRMEASYTRMRSKQPIEGLELSSKGLQRIHRHLFQDIYPWAGEFRTTDMGKINEVGEKAVEFCKGHRVKAVEVPRFFRELRSDFDGQAFDNLDKETFAYRASVYLADLNYIHPFVEGNGRTQRIFLEELARQSGYQLDHAQLNRENWIKASIDSYGQDTFNQYGQVSPGPHKEMSRLISKAVAKTEENQDLHSESSGRSVSEEKKSLLTRLAKDEKGSVRTADALTLGVSRFLNRNRQKADQNATVERRKRSETQRGIEPSKTGINRYSNRELAQAGEARQKHLSGKPRKGEPQSLKARQKRDAETYFGPRQPRHKPSEHIRNKGMKGAYWDDGKKGPKGTKTNSPDPGGGGGGGGTQKPPGDPPRKTNNGQRKSAGQIKQDSEADSPKHVLKQPSTPRKSTTQKKPNTPKKNANVQQPKPPQSKLSPLVKPNLKNSPKSENHFTSKKNSLQSSTTATTKKANSTPTPNRAIKLGRGRIRGRSN